jgi:hypothetical protein
MILLQASGSFRLGVRRELKLLSGHKVSSIPLAAISSAEFPRPSSSR